MSFALKWIQEAARLLKEAIEADPSKNINGDAWHEAAKELLKPKLPRYGE
jgi:hypothetical protein